MAGGQQCRRKRAEQFVLHARALVRGVREARIEVERLIGPRVGGGSGQMAGRRSRSVRTTEAGESAGTARWPMLGSKCMLSWRMGRGATGVRAGRVEKSSGVAAGAGVLAGVLAGGVWSGNGPV